VVVKT
jgi:hypothetical protein